MRVAEAKDKVNLWSRVHKGITGISGIILFGELAIFSTSISPASPQEQRDLTRPLQYEVSVVLKLVHVYVTDKKGNPVTDLAMGDFAVTDNGQPVNVTDFERHVLQPAALPKAEATEKPKTKTELVATPVPDLRQTGRKFFFFFDFAFNNARGIVKAKTAALHFLGTEVRPDDEIGILTYSMFKGVTVHEYLTKDHPKIREIVDAIGSKDIAGRAHEIEQQYWLQVELPLTSRPPGKPGQLTAEEQAAASNLEAQRAEGKRMAERFILSLIDLAKSLRYIPGQKHFLFFSTGVPSSMINGNQAGNPSATSLNSFADRAKFDPGDRVLQAEVKEMQREFGASGCVFYTFDTRESAKIADLFAYDKQTFETGARDFGSKQGVFQDSQSVFRSDKTTGLDSLKALSVSTGGKYYSNINMYEKNLDQVQSLTGTYYVLGYPVNERLDGKFHEVKVEVKRKGCEVRAQAGYFNPKPFSEYTDLEKQLHLFDLALNERAFSRMPANVPMTALSSATEGITRLAILARVPGEVTAKLSGKRVEFIAIFFDGKGEISDVVREEADPAPLRGHDMIFAAGTTLRPGDYSCRLVIRDMDTGVSAVATTKVTIVKPQITGLQLGTPLILAAGPGLSFVEAHARNAKERFSLDNAYPFDRSLLSPILTKMPSSTVSIQVVIPCSVAAGAKPDLALSANLVNSTTGERSLITIARMDGVQTGPREILTLEILVADIMPGTYYLHFYAEDRISKSLGHTFTTIDILKH